MAEGACGGNRKIQVELLLDNCPVNIQYSILCARSLPFLRLRASEQVVEYCFRHSQVSTDTESPRGTPDAQLPVAGTHTAGDRDG